MLMFSKHRTVTLVLSLAIVPVLASRTAAWLDPASPDVTVVLNSEDNRFAYGTGPLNGAWNSNYGSAHHRHAARLA
jgi:hypothetical protein